MSRVLLREKTELTLVAMDIDKALFISDQELFYMEGQGVWVIIEGMTQITAESIIRQIWEQEKVDLSQYTAEIFDEYWDYEESEEDENSGRSDIWLYVALFVAFVISIIVMQFAYAQSRNRKSKNQTEGRLNESCVIALPFLQRMGKNPGCG